MILLYNSLLFDSQYMLSLLCTVIYMYLEYSNRSYFRRHWPPMRHTHTRWSMLIQFAADKFLHVDTSELHGYGCCTLLMQPARTTLNRSQRQMS